ncbi:MAG TPA: neuraminidase-like domain-containing protein [Chitinophagaceae bacterium]|nr:neuraminidase-like domain-containing protein [Chitinophagaceae bacterium]
MPILRGTILDSQTRRPLSRLKIDAWDKDNDVSDQLGSTVSDERGRFTISYDPERYKDNRDNTLDVFFIVYKDNKVIHNTEERPMREIRELDSIVIEVGMREPGGDGPAFMVQGKVIEVTTKQPATGLRIEAWDRDDRKSDFLGMCFTNSAGEFTITYDVHHFNTDTTADQPDIFFRVFAGDACIHSTEAQPVRNPGRLYDIVIEIESDPDVLVPRTPIIFNNTDATQLHQFVTQPVQEIQRTDPAFYQRLADKAAQHLHESLVQHFSNISLEVRLFVRKLNLQDILSRSDESLKLVLKSMISRSRLSRIAKQEALEKLEEWQGPASMQEVIMPDMPLNEHPLFSKELKRADLFKAASITGLTAQATDQLTRRSTDLESLNDEFLEKLVQDRILTAAEAGSLGITANLVQLTAGDTKFAEIIRSSLPTQDTQALKHLATLTRADWETMIERNAIEVPKDTTAKAYAAFMRKQAEMLFPNEAYAALHRLLVRDSFVQQARDIEPLLANNEQLFNNIPFHSLNLSNIPEPAHAELKKRYEEVARVLNRYPGLDLASVMKDRNLSADQKFQEASRRVQMIRDFYNANKDVAFLYLDYSPDSEDLRQLQMQNLSEADRVLVLQNLRAAQRMYRLTQDAEHAQALMEQGYHAAYQIASDSFSNFARTTGMDTSVARKYYEGAQNVSKKVLANTGTIFDYVYGGLDWLAPVGNLPGQALPYLKRVDGFADLFGNQNFCRCNHCQSIISPAAYFVDLMDFLKKHILDEHFKGADANHVLSPKVRRPDLWQSLKLTCENTHTLIPYLVIINEILENYIATRPGSGFVGSLNNRNAVEDFVYKRLYNLPAIRSFTQPFFLPLTELEIYLSHFPLKKEQVAREVLAYMNDTANIVPQSQLYLSGTAYNLIAAPNAAAPFLSSVYGISFPPSGTITPKDVQLFLQKMDVTRKLFTELIQTRFVSANNTQAVTIKPITSPGSVQPDKEEIHALSLTFLDRLHRFVRLQRHIGWTVSDLDQVLFYLLQSNIITDANALPIPLLAKLSALQKQLKLKAPELIALFTNIPVDKAPSLFDALFNQPAFAKQGVWTPGTLSINFQHPAYRSDLPDPAGTAILHRLLAGLGMNDDDLFVLIENLKAPLASAADGTFTLNLSSLSLLYRHARLSRSLKISIAQLFTLMKLQWGIAGAVIDSVAKVETIVELVSWWKGTKFSVDDLSFILGNPLPATYTYLDPADTAADIADQVITEQHLIFAATLFSYFPGVTETQSREIIAANAGIIEKANIRSYRISGTVTDPATVAITIPAAIASTLTPADLTTLTDQVRSVISIHMQPGAPDIPDHALAGVIDLTRAQSQSILEGNPSIFEPVADADLYWLRPSFDPQGAIIIPAGIPVSAEEARKHLLQFYVGEIIPILLSKKLNISSDKVKALALLAGFNFDAAALGSNLALTVHGSAPATTLVQIVASVQKLSTWFKDAAFTSAVLAFMQQQSGGLASVFHIANYNAPTLANVRQTLQFLQLLKKAKGKNEELFTALTSFDFITTHQFANSSLDELSILLKAEQGIVTALNQVLPFPVTDPVTNGAANRSLDALQKLSSCAELVQFLGIGGEALPMMLSNDYDQLSHAVQAIVAAIRTKYENEEEYLEKIAPFEDKIREKKRDALTDYFIRVLNPVMFKHPNDLYHYFLIDTELGGCARTSRVVAGISSLQLYIQRCLMNLEQSQDNDIHVQPTDIPENEWEWRKNYRVWEANRKVFLWPENYIEPDLRDDKTPLFKELESELLQQEINAQTVQDAYSKYMKGFIEVAHLKIAGAYHDKSGSRDVLHIFGVSSSDPAEYYYRTIQNVYKSQLPDSTQGIIWGNWLKVNVNIPVRKVSPVVFFGKLYVFWTEIFTKAKNEMFAGSQLFTGYEHKMSVKFTSLNLDGSWTVPQELALQHSVFSRGPGIIWDPLMSSSEWSNILTGFTEPWLETFPFMDDGSGTLEHVITNAMIKGIRNAAKEEGVVTSTSYPVKVEIGTASFHVLIDFTDPYIRNILRPKYEVSSNALKYLHPEPRDNYSLKGPYWERVFPSPRSTHSLGMVGRYHEMITQVDLYERKAQEASFTYTTSVPRTPAYRRLTFNGSNIEFGYFVVHTNGKQYAEAEVAKNDKDWVLERTKLLSFPSSVPFINLEIVNGTLSDGLLNVGGDLLYLHSFRTSGWLPYKIKRLGTTLSNDMGRKLFESGFEGLLDIYYQELHLHEDNLPISAVGTQLWKDVSKNVGKLDTTGSMGVYFREILFHIPYLIANHLNSQGKYADAQRWYHFIFNPASDKYPIDYYLTNDPAEKKKLEKDRVWQYAEFRKHTLQTLFQQLNDEDAVHTYENDPFNPHAIARLRLGGYMKNIVMKYIDNLLDWGDHLFAQDTMESINEATLLYVMAAELLGRRPAELGDCDDGGEGQTFNQVYFDMNYVMPENDYLSAIESIGIGPKFTGTIARNPAYMVSDIAAVSQNASKHVTTGGVFENRYYGSAPLVSMEMRAMDDAKAIAGVTRGNDTAAAFSGAANTISTTSANTAALAKSNAHAQVAANAFYKGPSWKQHNPMKYFPLPSFGTTLLKQSRVFCIPQNKDLLAYWDRVDDRLYKIRHCMNISGMKRQLALFAPEIDPRLLVRAKAEGLSLEDILNNLNGNLPPYRFGYLIVKAKEYTSLLQSFGASLLSALEKKDAEELNRMRMVHQENIMKLSTKMRDQEIEAAELGIEALQKRKDTIMLRRDHHKELIDAGLSSWELAQQITKHAGNFLLPAGILMCVLSGALEMIPKIVGMANSTGGEESAESTEDIGGALRFQADHLLKMSDSMALEANFERRKQGWEFQLAQAESELAEMDKQIRAAEIRLEISKQARELHIIGIEQLEETFEFYENKFTNLGLYTWLSTQLQRMYRAAYQDALAMARLAERAYRFEKNDDTTPLLDGNYWDSSKSGLMAGERLQSDLRTMERKYMETHYRTMEVDQAFSLMQINPSALLQLKTTGETSFTIPELYFDLFYPGQYRRRIKSARLTVPSVTGPFTNVSATLTLTESFIRKDPVIGDDGLLSVPPMRSVTIATSTAQNDSGIFRLDFRDERYMPFEGAGAVNSTWGLSLPKSFRPFDYNTINDIILHISYTAEYDGAFREQVEGVNGSIIGEIQTYLTHNSIPRLFSMRQEFSTSFHRLFHQAAGTAVPLEFSEKHFPLFLQGRELSITGAKLVLVIDQEKLKDQMGNLPPMDMDITITGNGGGNATINSYLMDPALQLPVANIPTSVFATFNPATDPLNMTVTVNDAGVFAPADLSPGLPVVDNHKLKDIIVLLEYRLA